MSLVRQKARILLVVPVHVVMVMIVAVMVMMVSVLMGVALTLRLLDGLRLQPCGDIGDLAVEAEETAGDDGFGRRIRVQQRRAGVEPVQSLAQERKACLVRDEIGLGDDDPLGDGRLLHRFAMRIERGGAVDRIDHRHHAFDRVAHRQIGMIEHRMQDRRRIGEAGGLDDHALERQDAAVVALAQQVLERRDEVAAHGAAQAAGGEQNHALVDGFHQQVIEADLAELVDDHHRVLQRRILQEPVEQGGFARSQKAGEDGERDGGGRCHGSHGFNPQSAPGVHPSGDAVPSRTLATMAASTRVPPAICSGDRVSSRIRADEIAATTGSVQ